MLRRINKTIAIPVLVVVALDQVIKWTVVSGGLDYTLNRGLPLFGDVAVSSNIYVFLVLLLILLLLTANKYAKESLAIPVALIMSGALSNVIDRVVRGGVVDFIDIKIWPVFNLADLLLVVGAVWIAFYLLRRAV